MECPSCRHENPEEAQFCGSCGTALPESAPCPSCGAESLRTNRFCHRCGNALGAAPQAPRSPEPRSYTPPHLAERILRQKSALEGERKHVTVLFADVSGFTALSEPLDPEETHRLMDRCFQLILQWVHRFEGTVNQFLGDGVMALFGAPVALEDGPRRAVMAALGIQGALGSLHRELGTTQGIEFRMRIGIHTGLVVVGRIGDDLRMDYTAVGDTTNLASRLQERADPGTVVISEATQRLVSGYFDLRELGQLDIRGRSAPARAFEVLAERSARGRIDVASASGLTPLVGRERELGLLRAGFDNARGGRGQLAFLVGEAGIGKSRLVHEFRRQLEGEPHTWVEGHCASLGPATPFLPVIDGVRRSVGIDDRDDDATALAKLDRGVRALEGDLDWTLPFLRQLLSLPVGDQTVGGLDPATRRSETSRALHALLLRSAERSPLVFVIEDLHWIDPASDEFLRVLADAIPTARVLLLFTHRTGYRHVFGDRSYHVRIALQALSPNEMAAMTRSLLEASALPEELSRLIAEKAEGNPLFVEEVTKSLLEEGVLRIESGRVEPVRALGEITVPDSIQDVLMARIDRLDEEPKRAIQIASVIGREFAPRLLERIDEAGPRVSQIVRELSALELILQKSAYPELSYWFKHALIHDVAYASILIERRRALHGVIGRAIEELYRDRLPEHYETLATHFRAAEQWERALHYYELAAEKAARAYANEAVAQHCGQALEIAEGMEGGVSNDRRERLERMLAGARFCLSEYGASGDAYARAAEHSPDPEGRAMNLSRAAYSYSWAHSYDRSREMAGEGLAYSRKHGLAAGEGMARFAEGWHHGVIEGDGRRYASEAREALRLGEQSGNEEVIGFARYGLAMHAEWTGDYRRAVELLPGVIEIGRRIQLPPLVVWGNWFLGKALCCLGEYGRAQAQLEVGLELADRIGDRAWKSRLLNTLGWYLSEIESHERARPFNERAVRIARELGDDEIITNAEINLGKNHLALGDLEGALAYLEPLRKGLDRRDPWMRWRYALHLVDALARVELARGEPERALELADEQLAGAVRCQASKIEARALELQGTVLLALDRREEAERAAVRAVTTTERIEHPSILWRGLRLRAELAHRRGDRVEAEALAHARRQLLDGLARGIPDEELRQTLLARSAGPDSGV